MILLSAKARQNKGREAGANSLILRERVRSAGNIAMASVADGSFCNSDGGRSSRRRLVAGALVLPVGPLTPSYNTTLPWAWRSSLVSPHSTI